MGDFDITPYVEAMRRAISEDAELSKRKLYARANELLPDGVPAKARTSWQEYEKKYPALAAVHGGEDLSAVIELPENQEKIGNLLSIMEQECQEAGMDPSWFTGGWFKTDNGSYRFKLPSGPTVDEIYDTLLSDIKTHAPAYKTFTRTVSPDPHMVIIPPVDLHMNKGAVRDADGNITYSTDIARQRLFDGIQGVLNKSAGVNVDAFLLTIGNDWLHTELATGATTKGTSQDTEMHWFDAFQIAKQTIIETIEMLMLIADVWVVHVPDNHAKNTDLLLADTIASHFRLSDNVHFQVGRHPRKYLMYGNCLIGLTHGEGVKEKDLPGKMALEAKEHWGQAEHRLWLTAHLHHKQRRSYDSTIGTMLEHDNAGVTVIGNAIRTQQKGKVHVEIVRTISGTDEWHQWAGYDDALNCLEAFCVHVTQGPTMRISQYF